MKLDSNLMRPKRTSIDVSGIDVSDIAVSGVNVSGSAVSDVAISGVDVFKALSKSSVLNLLDKILHDRILKILNIVII